MLESTNIKNDRLYLWKLWGSVFVYTVLVSVFIQCILLRFLFPNWNDGNGLLISSLDSQTFHSLAVELAEKMRSQELSVWQLRPNGHPPAGIAALIYYTLKISKPWVLIPLNAALHATATLVLFLIIKLFLSNNRRALLSVLPFWLYPSAAIWYSQIHKDGYFILGSYLFLFGWLVLLKIDNTVKFLRHMRFSLLLILSGIILIWVIRPYFVKLFVVIEIIFGIIAISLFLKRVRKYKLSPLKAIAALLVVCALTATTVLFTKNHPLSGLHTKRFFLQKSQPKCIKAKGDLACIPEEYRSLPKKPPVAEEPRRQGEDLGTKNIPNPISVYLISELDSLISRRKAFLAVEGKSNIDEAKVLNNRYEALFYLCTRAIEVSLFAPFPNEWFKDGSHEANTIMRRIAIFEMLGIYFALCFLPLAIWFWRKRIEVFMILIFSLLFLSILGFIVCNIGTLYRFRYGFIMLLVALGIARASLFLKDSPKNKTN